MTTARTSIPQSSYDAFLYAAVRVDADGMPLTVLSFLARLNVDPWDEAARLAQLPVEAARGALAALIALLPEGVAARLDAGTVAARLVALLPARRAAAAGAAGGAGSAGESIGATQESRWSASRAARLLVVYVLWLAAMLMFQWYFASGEPARGTGKPAISTPADGPPPAAPPLSR